MKTKKITSFLSILLAILIIVGTITPVRTMAYTDRGVFSYSGSSGVNWFEWELDENLLTISSTNGNGYMKDFWENASSNGDSRAPWINRGYAPYITAAIISDGITHLGDFSFNNCTSLKEVTFPDTIDSIGAGVFKNCTSLEEIILPSKITTVVTQIGGDGGLFQSCTSLKELNFTSGFPSIPNAAARNCTSLKMTTIPLTVTQIGEYAYDGCTALKDVYYEGSKDEWNKISISAHNEPLLNAKIHYNCFIDPITGRGSSFIDLPVVVHENHNDSQLLKNDYRLSERAQLDVGGQYKYTKKNGDFTVRYEGEDITVSKSGYVSRTYDRAKLLNSSELYLQKESSSYPVISGLWMSNFDIINETYDVDPEKNILYTITPEIDWGNSSPKSVKLVQDEKTINILNGSLDIQWGLEFDITEPIYIIAQNDKGKTSRKKLLLEPEGVLPESLDGLEFSFGDSLTLTLPDSIDLFGGGELDLGVYSPVQIEVTVDNGKFYGVIGFNFDWENKDGQWKKTKIKGLCKQFKEAKESAQESALDMGNLAKIAKKNGGLLTLAETSFGVEAGVYIGGYFEGYLDEDFKPKFASSGLIITGNGAFKWITPYFIGPVPMYFEVKIGGLIKARLNLYNLMASNPNNTSKMTPEGELDWTFSLTGKNAIGIKKAVSVGGGLTGSWIHEWDIQHGATDHFIMKGKVEAFGFYSVLNYTYEKKFDSLTKEAVWIERPEKNGVTNTFNPDFTDSLEIYNTAQYKAQDLTEIKAVSNDIKASDNVLIEDSYINAAPQIVSFSDGTRLAAWIGYNAGRTDYDGLCLLASYYDGSSWSTPMAVDNDGYMDGSPTLKLIDDQAYLLWLNSSSSANNAEDLDELAGTIDISLAEFDKDTLAFSITRITESNGRLDLQPDICANGDTKYVTWLTNTENDWFGYNNANEIHCRVYEDGQWGEESTLYDGLNMIESMAIDYSNDTLNVAWSMDTDNDAETTDDLEIYVNGEAYTDNDVCDSSVLYYWNNLYHVQNGTLMRNNSEFLNNFESDQFTIIEGSSDSYIVYLADNGLATSVNALVYDSANGYWGFPIQLMESTNDIMSFSAAGNGNDLLIMTNEATVDVAALTYSGSQICLYDQGATYDLVLEDVVYDPYDNVLGSSMPFELTIRNNGTESVNKVIVTLENSNGETVKSIPVTVFNYNDKQYNYALTGEEDIIKFSIPLTDAILDDQMTLRIMPADVTDINPTDNFTELNLAYRNVGVQNINYGINGSEELCIYADIANDSYFDSGSFDAVLTNAEGEELSRTTISNVDPFTHSHVDFIVDSKAEGVYFISLEGLAADTQVADNSDFVVVSFESQETPIFNVTGVSIEPGSLELGLDETAQLTAWIEPGDAYNQAVTWSSSNLDVATVDENGLVTSISGGSATITVTTEDGGYQATCEVTVTAPYVAVTELVADENEDDFEILIGDTMQLHAYVLPENASNKNIIWESWEDSAEVDENGLVTAIAPGEVWIHAESEDNTDLYYLYSGYSRFRDVTDSSKYWFNPIYWAAEEGITNGYISASNIGTAKYGTFGIDENCTREQMITFLWRAAGKPNPKSTTKNVFSDVKSNAYYYKAVLWAYENGITKGYSSGPYKGKFGVGLPVTREDTVTFLYRMAKTELDEWSTEITDYDRQMYGNFTDIKGQTKKYYYDPIVWAAMYGITKGYSSGPYKGKFGVGLNVLRKDIVTFIYRYDDYLR